MVAGKAEARENELLKTDKCTPILDLKDCHGNNLINNIGHSFTNISYSSPVYSCMFCFSFYDMPEEGSFFNGIIGS
jgi:hypothetical protein